MFFIYFSLSAKRKGQGLHFFFSLPTSFLLSQHCILHCFWQNIVLLLQQIECKLPDIVDYRLTRVLSAFMQDPEKLYLHLREVSADLEKSWS